MTHSDRQLPEGVEISTLAADLPAPTTSHEETGVTKAPPSDVLAAARPVEEPQVPALTNPPAAKVSPALLEDESEKTTGTSAAVGKAEPPTETTSSSEKAARQPIEHAPAVEEAVEHPRKEPATSHEEPISELALPTADTSASSTPSPRPETVPSLPPGLSPASPPHPNPSAPPLCAVQAHATSEATADGETPSGSHSIDTAAVDDAPVDSAPATDHGIGSSSSATGPHPATSPVLAAHPEPTPERVYQLKSIMWTDPATGNVHHLDIITQNTNGPCPLIAICNVLLLRREISLRGRHRRTVTFEHLLQVLADKLVSEEPPLSPTQRRVLAEEDGRAETVVIDDLCAKETEAATVRELERIAGPGQSAIPTDRLSTILTLLPNLERGLDVNMRFHSIHAFEPTPELSLFVDLGVPLVHGWLPDPHSEFELWECLVVRHENYNRAVECLVQRNELLDELAHPNDVAGAAEEASADVGGIAPSELIDKGKRPAVMHKQEEDSLAPTVSTTGRDPAQIDALIKDGGLIEHFLMNNATQLTYHGLITLSTELPDHHLCVFFRNNHFSTLYKRANGELFLLVTDAGYANAPDVVWESLRDVDQDGSCFYNDMFKVPNPTKSSPSSPSPLPTASAAAPTSLNSPVTSPNSVMGDAGSPSLGAAGSVITTAAASSPLEQINDDYALALLIQEQDRLDHERARQRSTARPPRKDQRPISPPVPNFPPAPISPMAASPPVPTSPAATAIKTAGTAEREQPSPSRPDLATSPSATHTSTTASSTRPKILEKMVAHSKDQRRDKCTIF
ncbi:hypothetical protein IWQ60_005620 [Tieghemiomyces parasiticus]|uniref:MINDY deubiquitinase domain-containing protein n=1 Tax=Tieghemiomyces parasiticus TaxID=78921 RepID=A0A9W8A625_9FUNG|nr:hypothetical protein IWQ60_005620 [Tieghemiomyces parasiticus]